MTDNLSPTQLNKEIAEMMGWHGLREVSEGRRLMGMYGPLRGFMEVPHYSTDIAAAFELLKSEWEWSLHTCDIGYVFHLHIADKRSFSEANTIPLAIARAVHAYMKAKKTNS